MGSSFKTTFFNLLLIHSFITIKGADKIVSSLHKYPVIVTDFKVINYQQKAVYLEWITEKEINNHCFLIERSLDGVNFSVVGKVDAVGNSIKKHWYDFIDSLPKVGRNIYRLKQVDSDGNETIIEQMVWVEIEKVVDDFLVVPNPTTEDIEISFMAFKQGLIGIKILKQNGIVLKDFYLLSEVGLNNFLIDLSDLEKGEYVVTLNDGSLNTIRERIVKSN